MTLITPAEYHVTVAQVEKINARAAKKGFTGRITLEAEKVQQTTVNEHGFQITEVLYEVALGGEAPSYGGYRFIARIDWVDGDKPIVATAPGVEGVQVDRSVLRPGYCAHCKTNRFRRNTYVVAGEDGTQVQVGSTCIKDFLGWEGRIAWIDTEAVEKEIEGGWGGGYVEHTFTPETVISVAWAAIRAFGFVPASAGGYGMSTRDVVRLVLGIDRIPTRDDELKRELDQIGAMAPASAEQGRKVLDFILSDEFGGDSDYVLNLKTVAGAEFIDARQVGLLASAPQAYARHQERTLIREREAQKPSEFFGQEGDKVEFAGVIKSIRYIEGMYGTTVLYTIRNEESGNVVKWFASREALGDKDGVEVKIKGSIKKHEEWNGLKATVLTRCKAL